MDVVANQRKIQLIERMLCIQDKERHTVDFHLNPVQRYFAERKSYRNIILKARQLGISSLVLADMFIEAITVPNTICVVVSHEQHATERLLDKIHNYYKHFRLPISPQVDHASSTEITFPELNSTIYIGTARSMTFGRGERIDKAHLSELAYYEDGLRVLNAIEEAVPLQGEITVECSPNGEDNLFYDMWVKAKRKQSGYIPFFFPWWLDKDYAIPRGSPFALEEDREELQLDEEEQDLTAKYGLTEDQIRWRRRKIADKGGLFYQEYPEDEVNCFITSGEPVFDMAVLSRLARNCHPGEWHSTGFQIWIYPEEGMRYTVAADCSAGVDKGSFSAAVVLDELWRVCATFQARLEPTAFASILRDIAVFYNWAGLVIERNAQGYAVLAELVEYPNIYYQRDYTTGRITAKPGWWTSAQTKVFMITKFKEMLPEMEIWDIDLIRQARGYRYIKLEPKAQTFDDLLISCMIACAAQYTAGTSRGYVGAAAGYTW